MSESRERGDDRGPMLHGSRVPADEERRAAERFQALVRATGNIVWTNSAAGEMRGPQPDWCMYTGQSEEEVQGYGWSDAVHPDDAQPTIDAWQQAVATRTMFIFEHRVRRRDGVYRWFAIRGVPLLESDGSIREWVGLHRDIDDEKRAFEEIAVARADLEAIFANVTVGISFLDRDLRFRRINRLLAEDIHGLPVAAHAGKRASELLPNQRADVEPTMKRVLETGEVREDEHSGETPGQPGKRRTWRASYFPVRDASGEILGVGSVVHDITAQREADAMLERERNILALFVEHAPAQLAMFDREMRYLAASRRWLSDYGLTTDVLGKSHYEVFPELPERWREEHRRTLAGEVLSAEEDAFPRADGRLQWLRWETRPWYGTDGSIGGMIVASEDVTSRVETRKALEAAREDSERSRALLASAQQAAQIGIFEWDGRSEHVHWTAEVYALLGRRSGEIASTVESWNACMHPEDREAGWRALREAVAGRASNFQVEQRFLLPDGRTRWLRTSIYLAFDEGGEVVRCVGAVVDVQGLKELAESERQARLAAEEASRAKDDFLAMLGHELRNPLAPIATAVQLLKLRSKGSLAREVSVIERQSQHIARLVDDLLDVARVASGKVVLQRDTTEVADLVAAAIETASPAIENGRHTLVVDVPKNAIVVNVDRGRMTQVLANLLTNAAKYTPVGGRISVTAAREGIDVVISVEDTGVGISAELLPRVFDLFVQARQTLDRAQGGLGLGLALVKNLVGLHGGTVSADSAGIGRGSTFFVRLPTTEAAATGEKSSSPPIVTAASRKQRVLVVDDNTDGAELLAEALQTFGYVTAIAHDGPEALRVADEFAPDVALLDIGLPIMDGYELAARLRVQRRDVKLVAITGYGQESDRQRTGSAGFQAHLTKPVNLDQLVSLLAKLFAELSEPPAAPSPPS